jgi:hypothetical protein
MLFGRQCSYTNIMVLHCQSSRNLTTSWPTRQQLLWRSVQNEWFLSLGGARKMSRNPSNYLFVLATGLLSGCTSVALDDSMLSQGSSITLIQEEMVLANLEMFRQRPNALPWHLKITSGVVTVNDTISPSYSYGWPTIANTLGLAPSRSIQLQWSVVPVTDNAELTSLAAMYKGNIPPTSPPDPEAGAPSCHNDDGTVRRFVQTFSEGSVPPTSGSSGQFNGTYIWVNDDPKSENCFDLIVKQTLDAAPVSSQDRGLLVQQALPNVGR